MAHKANSLPLKENWLYAVSSPKDLARRLSTPHHSVSEVDLRRLAGDIGNYRIFPNKAGRSIQEPIRELQVLHKRIHILLSRIIVPKYLHSAVRGKSYLSNARAHRADVPLVKIDVKKFFQSVPRVAVYSFFLNTMRCRSDVAGLLADLLTFNGRLPTGSSASPIISYYAFKEMFDELFALAMFREIIMTCYVDDITFSGGNATKAFLFEARRIVARHGLKSHKLRIFSAQKPKIVTGVCITSDGERVPNKLHLKIAEGFAALIAANSAMERAHVAAPLLGRLHAAQQIDPKFGARAKTLRAKLKGPPA